MLFSYEYSPLISSLVDSFRNIIIVVILITAIIHYYSMHTKKEEKTTINYNVKEYKKINIITTRTLKITKI